MTQNEIKAKKTKSSKKDENLEKVKSKKATNKASKQAKSAKKSSNVKDKAIQNQLTSENSVLSEASSEVVEVKKSKYPKVTSPRLIKLFYKRNKLKKLRKNYGANFSEISRYFTEEKSAKKYNIYKIKQNEAEIIKSGSKNKDKNQEKKNRLRNFLYFALNIAVIAIVLAIQLSGEANPGESITIIFSANWWFLLAAFGMFVLAMFLDQIRYSILMRKTTRRLRLILSYKLSAVGRYYDVITPLSVGGQPFQIFYANKYGVKVGDGVSVITAKYIFQQIVYFIIITYILIRNIVNHTLISAGIVGNSVTDGIVTTLSWIGYVATAALLLAIMLMSLNRRMGTRLVAGILKLFSKIRIGKFKLIKDYNKTFISAMKTVNSWQKTTKEYSRSFLVIIVNLAGALLYIFANYTIPFFIYCAFAGWEPSAWINIVTIAVMVELASAFNPIPMGIGTADIGFSVLYGALFSLAGVKTAYSWAYIIWRILVYYIFIIQGLFVITYDYIIGDKKLKKYKEFWLLPFKERCKIKKDNLFKKGK